MVVASLLPILLLISTGDGSPVSFAFVIAISAVAAFVGIEVIVARPLRHVRQAIDAWRNGQPFDAMVDRGLPSELRAFSLSFKRANTRLVRRERELRDALARQDIAMQEIHHRVKNNLQIVSSLLNLQASRLRSSEIQAEFRSARIRVAALATVHRHLYAHGEVQSINMQAFLLDLCERLFEAMGETLGGRLTLEVEAPELEMSSDQAVPISLIVTEVVANAIKFAYPAGQGGVIRVRLLQCGDSAELDIADDGIGLAGLDQEPESRRAAGIGLRLIKGFARQLGSALEIDHANGTRYRLRIALRREPLGRPAFGRGKPRP